MKCYLFVKLYSTISTKKKVKGILGFTKITVKSWCATTVTDNVKVTCINHLVKNIGAGVKNRKYKMYKDYIVSDSKLLLNITYDGPFCFAAPPPPYFRQCIALFAVAEEWMLLDFGLFFLLFCILLLYFNHHQDVSCIILYSTKTIWVVGYISLDRPAEA